MDDDVRPEFNHPTSLHVAGVFLDILFGVLLGIVILEFPIADLPGKPFWAYLLFLPLYFALFLKVHFHWSAVRHDIAVFYEIPHYSATFSHYLTGLLMAFAYFASIRLLVVQFKSWPLADWAFVSFLTLISLIKLAELRANRVDIPRMVRKAIKNQETNQEPEVRLQGIAEWYGQDQPRLATWLAVPVLVLVPAIWLKAALRFAVVLLYLTIEFMTEARLRRARNAFWRTLEQR